MRKGWKIFFIIIISLMMLIIAFAFLSVRWLKNSLPQTSGDIALQGIHSEVKIYRDEWGIPHIFAENEDDLFFAQGFVQAQDRLWQMELSRRISAGSLSEIFGKITIDTDIFLKTIGLQRTAEKLAPQISPESRKILEAYAAGVNAFIKKNSNRLPLEFKLLGFKPGPWKIEHSLAYARLMAWHLSMGWQTDVCLGMLSEKLNPTLIKDIMPNFPKEGPFIVPQSERLFFELQEKLDNVFSQLEIYGGMKGSHRGSNSWVISGVKSYTGKPLLANDPHLGLAAPSVWYELHLSGPGIDVYGVSLLGVPGIVIGHNRSYAWGLTNVMVDDIDFYIEKINPHNSLQYFFQDNWHDVTVINDSVVVKDTTAIPLTTRWTHRGPIVSDIHKFYKTSGQMVSIQWTGYEFSDEFSAYYQILKGTCWDDFVEGLKKYKSPAQNFVYADTAGNIGYWCTGAIPIRKSGTGQLPAPGWLDTHDWSGYIPFEELPHLFNPPQDYIVTANNKTIDDQYPYFISSYWEPPYRASRIQELISQHEDFDIQDFKLMQFDFISPHAKFLVPYIMDVIADEHKFIADILGDWDYSMSADNTAATIFNVFLTKFFQNIYQDEMGEELYHGFISFASVPLRVTDELVRNGSSLWFDDIRTTDKTEKLNDIILKSIAETHRYLKENFGEKSENWHWGQLHTITFEHALGKMKPLNYLFNIGPFPVGGASSTISNGEYSFINPYKHVLGPSTRQIVDLANIDNSYSVITIGQSGQPLDKHYKDQTPLWLKGDYHRALMNHETIQNSGFDLLRLVPVK